jgi:ABC transport system ATP-binding/permease protein
MSEEILQALMQLFALIAKQDEGTSLHQRKYVESFLKQQLNEDSIAPYLELFDEHSGINEIVPQPSTAIAEENQADAKPRKRKRISMLDSVKTVGICEKINKTLVQKQKFIVLVRLYEMINSEKKFTEQRMELINTVGSVFKIDFDVLKSTENFVVKNNPEEFDDDHILVISKLTASPCINCKHISSDNLDGYFFILKIKGDDLYFLRYTGHDEVQLNGQIVSNNSIYLFANGSTIKSPKGKPIFYSDVISHFLSNESFVNISFNAQKIVYHFPNGAIGLQGVSISEKQGKLVGIMGASGSGKTTLLNLLVGNMKPSSGEVLLNGINIHNNKEKIEGVFGYIPQDDLLMEELTVFQNLYYNAKLCFKDKTEEDITKLVNNVLHNLGLSEIKSLKVGSPMNKTISGGQRKRLNIALELIREPSVLFVDEPTSGLSSRDSENVIDLLRELALKGKLIFVVIHQPSSDIYKMFDRIVILDTGGYLIYNGNPVEAISYFKKQDRQVNSEIAECPNCGNVNPEIIFNIIESKVVDEYGNLTDERKVSPVKWRERFNNYSHAEVVPDILESPPKALNIPEKFKQIQIFSTRDFLSKISNLQYVIINLVEAPLLAFFLSFIIRYVSNTDTGLYIFRENENIPAYIFMCIIVALFIGLTVSAEEIFRDKKILKREAFLNLSRGSYLVSKVGILFTLSAIQTILFVLVGNSILEIKGMYFDYWIMLFSVSCFANMLGLNISSAFNSAVTIYILIPLLIIPQMVLGGAMFSYDKLNHLIGGGHRVPAIAETMAARWAYEGIIVRQFINNPWQSFFYDIEKKESEYIFKQNYYLPELNNRLKVCREFLNSNNDSIKKQINTNIKLLENEIKKELDLNPRVPFKKAEDINFSSIDQQALSDIKNYFDLLSAYYSIAFDSIYLKKEYLLSGLQTTPEKAAKMNRVRDSYYNDYLSDLVKNVNAKKELTNSNERIVQIIDPIYFTSYKSGFLSMKSHFYAPEKHIAVIKLSTFWFNVLAIWIMTIILYIALYFDWLAKILLLFEQFIINAKNKNN